MVSADDSRLSLEFPSREISKSTSVALATKLAQLTPTQRQCLQQALGTAPVSGHEHIAQTLKALGISHVYGIAGVPIDQTLSCCAAAGLRVIGTRHQQGATLMAAAQNYAAGRLVAAVIVSSGPAITNTLTGVLVAWDNAWPLLILAGGKGMGPPGRFQELAALPLFEPITKAAWQVSTVADVAPTLANATQLAMGDRPGPVFIDFDEAILNQSAPPSIPPVPPNRPILTGDSTAIGQATALLQQAQRPLLVMGKGLRWSAPYEELKALTAKGLPFITSPMGRGFLPDDDPAQVTPAAALALSTADVVLSIGARWNWTFRFGAELSPAAKLIQVDIHAPEIGRNVPPTVGIVGDARAVLQALVQNLETTDWWTNDNTHNWRDRLQQFCAAKREEGLARIDVTRSPMNFETFMTTIASVLPRTAITVLDGNYTLEAGSRYLPCYTPASRLTPGTNGCMGTGIPFAIGAKMAQPDRLVVAICGDLSFGMAALEIETAIRHQLPIIIIVANNQGNAGAHRQQQFYGRDYPERVTMFVPDARYDQIATAFGGAGANVATAAELKIALQAAIAAPVLTCLNVHLDPEAPSPRI